MKKFFITTAIDYPSGPPHAGHLYEKICADCIARWHRLLGDKVHFSTGLDCHGQKIEQKAKQAGLEPEKFVESMEPHYRKLCEDYSISFDDFIKTTEKRHKKVVFEIFKKINANGDIYKGVFEGQYCVECETFYTTYELGGKGVCPVHNKPLQLLNEESYFFKMSKYQKKLIELLNNSELLVPQERRHEMLNRLKEPLRDLSISRVSVKWGIEFPLDKNHRFFVWLDALVNYLSTIDYPSKKFEEFWPSDAHIIGRDIVWHHTIIWWSLLMSAGLALPKIVSHGFVNTETGDKMSKAAGNIISPDYLHEKFGSDSVRYFFLREIIFGFDGKFSEEALIVRHNNELANELGNLLNRTLVLLEKNCGGKIPKATTDQALSGKLNLQKIKLNMERFETHLALSEIMNFVKACNAFVNEKEPWKLTGARQEKVLYSLADSLRLSAVLLSPFIPQTSVKILAQLGVKNSGKKDLQFNALFAGTKIARGEVLFKKIES